MLCTIELDMANTVETSDIEAFLTDAAWTIWSTYHTVVKASTGATIFGQDMVFTFPSLRTGTKQETIGSTKQTSTQNVKITHIMIGINW